MEGNDVIELAGGFAAVDEVAWMAAVEAALKGRPFDRLRSTTYDGLTMEPLYRGRRDAEALVGRAAGLPWTVMARVEHPDPGEANAMMMEELENGAGGIDLIFAPSKHARGAGLAIDTIDDMERLFDGVLLDLVVLRLDAGYQTRSALAMLLALAEKRAIDPAALNVRVAIDPIGSLAANGWLTGSIDAMSPRLWDLVHFCQDTGFKGPLTSADGRTWHGAGASEAQELAYTLATAVTYLRMLDGARCEDLYPQDRVEVVLAADADQFATIAKLRAMRRLWARVLDASGLEQKPLLIHAETAWRMMTRRDPWVNMLRTTVAAFAAGVGGADSVTVLPFTEALGVPDSFARRVARNTQTILIEESNLHRVADPAAGSGAVEAMTDALVAEAWKLFQQVEAEGGIDQAYCSGSVAAAIGRTKEARARAIATRRDALTGTSSFPNLSEKAVSVMKVSEPDIGRSTTDVVLPPPGQGELSRALVNEAASGATTADLSRARDALQRLDADILKPCRVARHFEMLREASDAYLEMHGRRPTVLLANFGRVADFTARATWAKNVFEAGGIEAEPSEPLGDAESAEYAFRKASADIACLCSSDALYAETGAEIAAALKKAGAAHVYIAGRPVDEDGALEKAGVEIALYEGCDVLGALRMIHASLGLSELDGEED
ncbi:heterodimeric methylmalonyl-CoA mutase small subunit [Breoghania corrubedonensis]|uniref:Heterodimeric methylmalonyl-CoA mutase small subunit n=1 Tax=Breoghania corrubedonensis TaxID=665038 RepID=A0A2T5UW57_9HYPH|nr:methylmalonyl-CoA mutase family protein [Breoghania corrubedonensis]PTW55747.1 heterodimeric methylmalonyl-CoA mutase small subunit [Breoghania corrubedonensis]